MANTLAPDQLRLQHQVTALADRGGHISVFSESPDGPIFLEAKHVALAMPPRLCSELHYEPRLGEPVAKFLDATPTWMAAHAKFTAVYETPFWREAGLSGDAMSRRGPMAEIHDISPMNRGPYALFGFIGLGAEARRQIGAEELTQAALQQLADIFGSAALSPLEAKLQDWSTEAFTAAPDDKRPLGHHPVYGLHESPDAPWTDRLHFISAETARENGGLIEGALQRGLGFAAHVLAHAENMADGAPRTASMSWDWLEQDKA